VTLPSLDALEAAAKAATPGPWEVHRPDDSHTDVTTGENADGMRTLIADMDLSSRADAHFIALANPAVVLGLVERVRKAEAMLRTVEWKGETRIDYDMTAPACPECGGISPDFGRSTLGEPTDHATECALAAILSARPVEPSPESPCPSCGCYGPTDVCATLDTGHHAGCPAAESGEG
jgi:hypothetical protein